MLLEKTMTISFYKYQGTGNDFLIIDNRSKVFPKNDANFVKQLCNRRLGIGADGLILLENDMESDFEMVYYNADGRLGSMCGNGGRCIVAFAKYLDIIGDITTFKAVDGMHSAKVNNEEVSLRMKDVSEIAVKQQYFFLDTGSPHHVQLVSDLETLDVNKEGAKIRYGLYGATGSNINFVEQKGPNQFFVRTYERGVENETLSCGTGVTAVALSMYSKGATKDHNVQILTRGGALSVSFKVLDSSFIDISLKGPAKQVFKGKIEV